MSFVEHGIDTFRGLRGLLLSYPEKRCGTRRPFRQVFRCRPTGEAGPECRRKGEQRSRVSESSRGERQELRGVGKNQAR